MKPLVPASCFSVTCVASETFCMRASPTSASRPCMSQSSRMFAGLMSRWKMMGLCTARSTVWRYSSARATHTQMCSRSAHDSGCHLVLLPPSSTRRRTAEGSSGCRRSSRLPPRISGDTRHTWLSPRAFSSAEKPMRGRRFSCLHAPSTCSSCRNSVWPCMLSVSRRLTAISATLPRPLSGEDLKTLPNPPPPTRLELWNCCVASESSSWKNTLITLRIGPRILACVIASSACPPSARPATPPPPRSRSASRRACSSSLALSSLAFSRDSSSSRDACILASSTRREDSRVASDSICLHFCSVSFIL
mmetsp:Transcript_25360/g.60352  ORF Transcript_25360/g.60352 Transcript_25360/m.60352 type:complete len:306 (-) Transcript_25360:645-1562(-)